MDKKYQVTTIPEKGAQQAFMYNSNVGAFEKANNLAKTTQYKRIYVLERNPKNVADTTQHRIYHVK
jgi:hypothetical protein